MKHDYRTKHRPLRLNRSLCALPAVIAAAMYFILPYFPEFTSQDFNVSFIKANGVESGVLSYNQTVEPMLKYYDKKGML